MVEEHYMMEGRRTLREEPEMTLGGRGLAPTGRVMFGALIMKRVNPCSRGIVGKLASWCLGGTEAEGGGGGASRGEGSFVSCGHSPGGVSSCPLPVLQLLCDTLGESATEESHQEEQGHAHANHGQDVVLGGRCHHLHGEVRESVRRSHLETGEDGVSPSPAAGPAWLR